MVETKSPNHVCVICEAAFYHSRYNKNTCGYACFRRNENIKKTERRHRSGESKRYLEDIKKTPEEKREYNRLYQRWYKHSSRDRLDIKKQRYVHAGELTKKTIQMVYEHNIKFYGTLTCCLCYEPIRFGDDSLEHKLPLSRGGTNEYDNLGVAHLRCNKMKNNKTLDEFVEHMKGKGYYGRR